MDQKPENTRSLLGLCVLLAFLSMPVAFFAGPMVMDPEPEFVGFRAEFVGQETAEVGELVRFLAEGEIVRWECLPQTSDSESYGPHNENYVVSFRQSGTYTVIAAIYNEGELTIHTQPVTVEGITPVDPPVDPAVPLTLDKALVSKVEGWVIEYAVDSEMCNTLASNFSQVAEEIRQAEVQTPGEIIRRTAELNADLTLNEGLMAELQAYLTSQSDVGNLKTPDQHLVVWNSIAKGLRNAAK